MGKMKAGTKMGREKEETAKRGVKRGKQEAVISSIGSSTQPFCQTNLKRWKRGRYIPIYLTLVDEVVRKAISFDGPMWKYRFWVSFTAEFNKRVKESITKPKRLARFKDFKIEDVIKYKEGLQQTYNENKNKEVVMLKDFHLYEKAFKHCDCFTSTNSGGSRGSMKTTSSLKNGELKEALDQLSRLRRSGKLRLEHVKDAMNNFKENAEVAYLWLRLSSEDQVMWIKEHL